MIPEVTSLGYLVVTAQDLDAWRRFGESILGLQAVPGPDRDAADALYFRLDDRSWRLAVEHGPDNGTTAIGLEVSTRGALVSLRKRLVNAGVEITEEPGLAERRGVLEVFKAKDPSGHPLEFFVGARSEVTPFISPVGARFVTGAQGLGHVVLFVSDYQKVHDFYVGTLGFRVSDVLTGMGPECSFTSPNPRHHTVAFVELPGVQPMLQHFMLEVDEIDTVGRAWDRVQANDVPISLTLGRHSNDHMLSFYCQSPSTVKVEYGWGGLLVGGDHTTGHFSSPTVWGHRPPPGQGPMDGLDGK